MFSAISTYHTWNPPPSRADLTIFIEHVFFDYDSFNSLEIDVIGKVVNDSPRTSFIIMWDLFVNADVNFSYEPTDFRFVLPNATISQTDEVAFNMGKTLVGENKTRIPQTAIRSVVVTFWYEDEYGLQTEVKEKAFV